jgi:hypothetical protein
VKAKSGIMSPADFTGKRVGILAGKYERLKVPGHCRGFHSRLPPVARFERHLAQ